MTSPRKSRMGSNNGQFSHGFSGSPEYITWSAIKRRCLNRKDTKWHIYGGRGIKVCQEWQKSFLAFYNHVGPKPSKTHSIDRKNINGHYEPGNAPAPSNAASPSRRPASLNWRSWGNLASGCSVNCAERISAMTLMVERLRIRPRNWAYLCAFKLPSLAAKTANALDMATSHKCASEVPSRTAHDQ